MYELCSNVVTGSYSAMFGDDCCDVAIDERNACHGDMVEVLYKMIGNVKYGVHFEVAINSNSVLFTNRFVTGEKVK